VDLDYLMSLCQHFSVSSENPDPGSSAFVLIIELETYRLQSTRLLILKDSTMMLPERFLRSGVN
jgi:hypothetical protein